jgi:DNA-binding response OmpR family regulator
MKILLLEDDVALHNAMRTIFLEHNYEVTSFYDGGVLYENIDSLCDLYLLDVNVPNMNGLELTKLIKSCNPQAKIIIISASRDIDTIKEGYANGCDDYLKKPFDIEELLIKIKKLIVPEEQPIVFLSNEVKYDLINKILYYNNQKVELTKKELQFIHLLILNRDLTITYENIIDQLYMKEGSDLIALRSLVKRIRRKLPDGIIQRDSVGGYRINSTNIL